MKSSRVVAAPAGIAGRGGEARVGPEQGAGAVGHGKQIAARGDERLQQIDRQLGRIRIVRGVTHALADC